MATTFVLTIACRSQDAVRAESVLRECHRALSQLENELTEFRPISPVYQLNQAPVGQPVSFTAEGLRCLKLAETYRLQTGGAFDALGGTPPVEVRFEQQTVLRLDPYSHLGFGAIGKGFALDEMRSLVEREGFSHYYFSGGGSSLIISGFQDAGLSSSGGDPWSWAWSWKRDAESGAPLGIQFSHPSGKPIAIGVSGTHEKGRHIVDPRAESKAANPARAVKSALVASRSAVEADALSTALFVRASREGLNQALLSLQNPLQDVAAAIIDADEQPEWNGVFQNAWGRADSRRDGAVALLASAVFLGLGLGWTLLQAPLALAETPAGESVDLGSLGLSSFTPYVNERSFVWILLPIFTLAVALLHLRKIRHQNLQRRRNT